MIELKGPAEIDKMAVTGAFVAETLTTLSEQAQPGVNLMDLEHHCRDLVATRGAVSCYWDYAPEFGSGPFRNVICLSVNDRVLHGLPFDHTLAAGDVLSLDFAVSIDGWVADSALTVVVGDNPDPADVELIESTRRALDAGIAAAVVGGRLGDISAAIENVARETGKQVNTDFGGHGLGRTMHEDPHVANAGRAGSGLTLRAGMTLALEPWWSRGTAKLVMDPDGWTLRSADGSMTAHSEHTIAITDDGPRILTPR
ncbi:type I methionyl aminopeptidase [Rhodococcus sp. BP-316]|jgi:methionyl aminopeptidase|uniref:type I methionyl aminopeptidase n=1 Tax=unclassified Rhodococcus (in: high G+C Gram-positive bacteria) TaxID=192944 RepID=UPI0004821716|nr:MULTISPECIES: type I methionyl aminopeptidase [unclassified Rhodococcus (in: high G+C Gram-positive bacteria)]KQU34724.1 methionine aminopeptidase [Rhodococcus sp. Leaf225]KQU45486.1 methionine aminopeptidase [Rhodococcus sp. Leaf258]MBY6679795.1 type I methionyl aminopeptidase [Rhodococcus sp. BP-316]MDQ1180186.1 methionyl aminopeptidase [Rhodococcus sp. SORGH_AS_0301]MDQ1201513.1 methionyl aminopeptidase [Rhodococcus sp. SORGH_AS_0303]